MKTINYTKVFKLYDSMKHVTLSLIFLFVVGTFSYGQDNLQLSLSEAQDYAIEHNKTIQNARLDITLSEQKTKEAIAQGLPQIDATLDWMTYFGYEAEFNIDMGGSSSFTQEQLTSAMQNTMNNFQGVPGVFDPVTPQDFYNYAAMQSYSGDLQAMLPPSTIKMTDQSTAKLQVGQLLYSGQYWTGLKVSKLSQKIAEQGLDNSILDIKESITGSYYMILVTEKSIETFKKSIASLNKVKGHTQNMFKSGMAEQTDVDQISIQVTMLENTLRSMERGLQMLNSMMKFQLGIENTKELVLTESLDEIMTIINPTNTNTIFDINANTTYKLLQTQEEITSKMIDMEKMAYAPTISAFYAYNHKLLTTGFDMTPNHVAGATLSLPLFSSGSRKHKVSQAKINLDKVQLNKSMVAEQLNIQNKQLILDLNTAIENYNSQKENVEIATRVYKNIQNKYEQGMASSLDLTQSNNNYLQAESNYIQSVMALLQAKVAINKLHNNL